MLIRFGHSMITVPLSPAMAGLCRRQYRDERQRYGRSRSEARREVERAAFYYVVADHPEFGQRLLADAPSYMRRAS